MGKVIIDNGFKYKGNSKDFLEALMNNTHYCGLLRNFKKEETYEKLLHWILSYEPVLTSTGKEFPDLKEIYKMAGIPYSHIGTDLRDIYFAIFKLNVDDPSKFVDRNRKLCQVLINCFGERVYFRVGLGVIPRAGEKFTFSFVKPILGFETFWVKNVNHEIYNGGQILTIELDVEPLNLYLQLLTEKAYLNDKIPGLEYYGNLKDETREKLVKLYKNL
ncbi:MAG: hypothetical protein HYX39_10710 [Bacteroidetes bacterium]|nr:hypothetical protein [Bacteroidota bacterium]